MHTQETAKAYGILARFEDPDAMIAAAEKIRDSGYTHTDAFTSFPVHGIYEALGARKSRLALAVLIGGIAGACGGMLLQEWVSVTAYPHIVSGKPFFSWPSFVPIIFECTVLGASLTAFVGMLARNGLPRPHHPIFESTRFEQASTDGFFICIEGTDPKYDEAGTLEFVQGLGAADVEVVPAGEES